MNILSAIQTELNAPKNQRNNFGKYNYRSCEDILEGLKPLLKKYECAVIVDDDLVMLGDRFYIKATAKLVQDSKVIASSTGFAREALTKKGMDESQITGATSSYARKYALNGLFAIDDNKDADTDEHRNNSNNRPPEPNIKDQIRNYLNSGKMPVDDVVKYREDLNSHKIQADENLLNKLISIYGTV